MENSLLDRHKWNGCICSRCREARHNLEEVASMIEEGAGCCQGFHPIFKKAQKKKQSEEGCFFCLFIQGMGKPFLSPTCTRGAGKQEI